MNTNAVKKGLFPALALSAALAAPGASAALITEWGYEINSAFTGYTETGGDGSVVGSAPNAVLGGSTLLEWGADSDDVPVSNPSSLEVDSVVTPPPNLFTGGASINGATITHSNEPIPADSSFLETFQVTTVLDLTAVSPANGFEKSIGPIQFDSFFKETFNEDSLDDCLPGSVTRCDDIFVLLDGPGGGAPAPVTSQSFKTGGYLYTVSLDLGGLGVLSDDECTAAGSSVGCLGFTTPENASTPLTPSFSITAVPEPMAVGLLGLGLLGLGYGRRRLHSAA